MSDLEKILREHGLSDYTSILAENRIDLDVLEHITDDQLKEMGIPLGDSVRIRILARSSRADAPTEQPISPTDAVGTDTSEIRQITVLFADLVGSTELATSFDVEECHGVLASFHERCSEIVRANGGMPARFIGDALLACFGFPQATENDAVRAVQAAEQIAKEVPKMRVGLDYKPRARVGVATGLAMTGNLIAEGQQSFGPATGATLNLAARLQALATPDTVLIDQTTRGLLTANSECAFLGERNLKGFAEAQPIWRLDGQAHSTIPAEQNFANEVVPLIGRAPELATLDRHWQESERKGSIVLIAGEAGIGKSRTLNEFVAKAGILRNRVVRMECIANEQLRPLRPVIKLLEALSGTSRVSDPQSRTEKLIHWVVEEMKLSPKTAEVLTRLIVPDQEATKDASAARREGKAQIFETLTLLIDRMGLDGPNLFVIEDIHWIDPTTQEFLDHLTERIASMKAMLICTYRPDHHPNFIGQPRVSLISLSRLEDEQSAELIDSVLQERALPPDVVSEIIARADGIPFFVEELTKSAVETGPNGESAARSVRSLPTTLHGSLLARLDRVPGVARIAPIGAAIGRTFPLDLVLDISGLTEGIAQPILDGLSATGLLSRSGVGPKTRYTFKHALVRDAAYGTMPKSRRVGVHRRIADALEKSEPAGKDILAWHFSEAGQHAKACAYWKDAALAAHKSSADREAVACIESALGCVDRLNENRERLDREIDLRETLRVPLVKAKFGSKEIEDNLLRLRALRDRRGDIEDLLGVLHGLSSYYIIRAKLSSAEQIAEEILERYGAQRDVPRLLGLRLKGICRFWSDDLEVAERVFEEAIELNQHCDRLEIKKFYHADTEIISRGMLCWILSFEGPSARLTHELQAAEDAAAKSEPWNQAYAYSLMAAALQNLGSADACLQMTSKVIDISEEHEFEYWMSWCLVLNGWATVQLSDAHAGCERLREGIDRYAATGSVLFLSYARPLLADCLRTAGRDEEAAIALHDLAEDENCRELMLRPAQGH